MSQLRAAAEELLRYVEAFPSKVLSRRETISAILLAQAYFAEHPDPQQIPEGTLDLAGAVIVSTTHDSILVDMPRGGDRRRYYFPGIAANDAEPITSEWLRSVGFGNDDAGALRVQLKVNANCLRWLCIEPDWSVAVSEGSFDDPDGRYMSLGASLATRGDVRRLCKALGIFLKESTEPTA